MTKITSTSISEQKGFFLKKDFQWSDIFDFSVIAGINGSGKTKLSEISQHDIICNPVATFMSIDI